MMNGNQNNEKLQASCKNKFDNGSGSDSKNDSLTTSKDDEFQLLNALEIFWNINSDNIDLLNQNWG